MSLASGAGGRATGAPHQVRRLDIAGTSGSSRGTTTIGNTQCFPAPGMTAVRTSSRIARGRRDSPRTGLMIGMGRRRQNRAGHGRSIARAGTLVDYGVVAVVCAAAAAGMWYGQAGGGKMAAAAEHTAVRVDSAALEHRTSTRVPDVGPPFGEDSAPRLAGRAAGQKNGAGILVAVV